MHGQPPSLNQRKISFALWQRNLNVELRIRYGVDEARHRGVCQASVEVRAVRQNHDMHCSRTSIKDDSCLHRLVNRTLEPVGVTLGIQTVPGRDGFGVAGVEYFENIHFTTTRLPA